MKKYDHSTAQHIFWVGAMILFITSVTVGCMWGFLAQLAPTILLFGWGSFVRVYLTKR